MTTEFAHTPERQSGDVIGAARDAVDVARDARGAAQSEYDSWGHVLAGYALRQTPVPADYAEIYAAREKARDEAREALQAARVAWYHSMGKHAHGFNPELCCGVASPTGEAAADSPVPVVGDAGAGAPSS